MILFQPVADREGADALQGCGSICGEGRPLEAVEQCRLCAGAFFVCLSLSFLVSQLCLAREYQVNIFNHQGINGPF